MPDLAAIKAIPQTADAQRQSAKKPDNRPGDEEKRPEFQSEYESGDPAQEEIPAENKTDSSDELASSEKEPKVVETSPEEAKALHSADTPEIDAPPDSFALAPAAGTHSLTEEAKIQKSASEAVMLRQGAKTVLAGISGAAETGASEDPGASPETRSEPDKMLEKTGKSTAETVIMSKVAHAGNVSKSSESSDVPVLPKDDNLLRTDARGSTQEKPVIAQQVTPARQFSTLASEMVVQGPSPEPARRQKAGDWRRLGPDMAAETAIQRAPGLTAGALQPTNVGATQPQLKPGALKEKIELMPFSGLDMESITALDSRSATQTSSTALAQHLNRADMPMMIGRQMAEALQKAQDRPVEIALNPRELGRVRMSISAAEAGITVSVIAERPETLDLMRRNIEQLTREFQTIGYENIAFSFSGGEARQDFSDQQNDENRPAVTRLDLTSDDNLPPAAPRMVATSGVDLRL